MNLGGYRLGLKASVVFKTSLSILNIFFEIKKYTFFYVNIFSICLKNIKHFVFVLSMCNPCAQKKRISRAFVSRHLHFYKDMYKYFEHTQIGKYLRVSCLLCNLFDIYYIYIFKTYAKQMLSSFAEHDIIKENLQNFHTMRCKILYPQKHAYYTGCSAKIDPKKA